MSKLHELIQKFRTEIPHFISTDIVQIESGISLGGGSIDPNFDSSIASASYAQLVKSNAQALDLLGVGSNSTEDILITTAGAYLLIRLIGHEHYHGLAISRQGTPGFARVVMKKYEPLILQALRHLHET